MLPRTLFISVVFICGIRISIGLLPVVTVQEFHKQFQVNHQRVLCALFQQRETADNCVNYVYNLSQDSRFKKNIAGVVYDNAAFPLQNVSITANDSTQSAPFLKCLLAHGFSPELRCPQNATNIARWLNLQKAKIKHMWKDDVSHLDVLRSSNNVSILALPMQAQLAAVDAVVDRVQTMLRKTLSTSKAFIHPHSEHARQIRSKWNLPEYDSLFLVYNNMGKHRHQQPLLFKGKDIECQRILVESFAHLSEIKHLGVTNFEWEAMTVKKTERFQPYIVIFYAWWAESVLPYLNLVREAVREIQALSVTARFALVNVAAEKTVMSRYVDVRYFKSVPFIAVFQKEKGKDAVNQTLIYEKHPSTFYLYSAFKASAIQLPTRQRTLWEYQPYAVLECTNYSDLREGPFGSLCTAWASNQTESSLPVTVPKQEKRKRSKIISSVEKQMKKSGGLPLLTHNFWDAVIEKSQFFTKGVQFEPKIKISVVAFVKEECGSCNKKMQVFQEVARELVKTDYARLYLVNCSMEESLCKDLEVKGFPTIYAFRSFATLATLRCPISADDKPYVRRDYHGPISTWYLMSWIELLSANSLRDSGFKVFEKPTEMAEDDRLVATVIPKYSNYLPVAPGGDRNYFYTPQCLRLACERLYGLATCHLAYSTDIPEKEFTKNDDGNVAFIVTKITFERKDGVSLDIMMLGKSLHRLMEEETSTDTHLFHSPHQYNLSPTQTCEEDHDACTNVIVDFVQDHMRLPVTQLTSEIFHTRNNPLFQHNRPVLIALSTEDNILSTTSFMQVLENVAKTLYQEVTVTVLDVNMYPAWAGSFVPLRYSNLHLDCDDGGPLHKYPRACVVDWNNHKQAAFYPPLSTIFNDTVLAQFKMANDSRSGNSHDKWPSDTEQDIEDLYSSLWSEDQLLQFLTAFLEQPEKFMVLTEQF